MEQNNAERNKVQPGNNAPMWRGVAAGVEGYSSLPKSQAPEAGILIQGPVQYPGSRFTTAGEAWRQVRNNWIIPYGGALFLIVAGRAGDLLLRARARSAMHDADSGGRRIERFTPFERAAHWANAIAFVHPGDLGHRDGLRQVLPAAGHGPARCSAGSPTLLKTLHNFAGPLFAVSLVIVFFTFVRDNLPQRGDLNWLLKAGRRVQQVGQGAALAPLQRRREGRVLGRRARPRRHRRRLRPGAWTS